MVFFPCLKLSHFDLQLQNYNNSIFVKDKYFIELVMVKIQICILQLFLTLCWLQFQLLFPSILIPSSQPNQQVSVALCSYNATPRPWTEHCTAIYYITIHYTTVHYNTVHYTTLYYITLQYTTLHYSTVHFSKLNYGPV